MSIWPFANRATAKPRRGAPQPAQSAPSQPSTDTTTSPVASSPAVRKSKRRSLSRLQKTPSPTAGARRRPDATAAATAVVTPAATARPQHPLNPIAPASPMDLDFATGPRPRASTGGSAAAENITALPGSRALRTSPHLRPVTQETADIPYNWTLRTATGSHHSLPSNSNNNSNPNSQRRSKLQRNPSRNKRAAQHESPLARRRSSKKRRNDPLREEEIRAMSAPIDVPKRGSRGGAGGGDTGILRRESRKSRGPLNRNFERPTSTVSLPFEDSIHSSMSGEAEPRNYRLSVLDVMSPRPTIRFRDAAKPYGNDHAAASLVRKTSRSEKPSGKAPAVQTWRPTDEEMKARERARIDSLADDMDSTELRDILERDRKRKEKKQRSDAERLKRKLERRAEKQRTKEWLAQQQKEAGAKDLDDQPMESGLGIETEDEAPSKEVDRHEREAHMQEEADFHMEDVEPALATTEEPIVEEKQRRLEEKQRQEEPEPYHDPEKQPISLEDIHPAFRARYQEALDVPGQAAHEDDARREPATPMSDVRTPADTPVVDTAQAISYTAARPITPLTPVTSSVYHGDRVKASKILGTDVAGGSYTMSSTALHDAARPKDASPATYSQPVTSRREEPLRKEIEAPPLSVSKKRGGFLASLFRGSRRSVSEAPRDAPSAHDASFSNASREEMAKSIPSHLMQQQPQSVAAGPAGTYFKKAGPPLRTTSIFREDLPESPQSPPDSRITSPADTGLSAGSGSRGVGARRAHIPSAILSEGSSSRMGSPENDGDAPTSPISARASGLMSQSLASVDSEASWLSGKPQRTSSRAHKHSSLGGGSLGRREEFQGSYEELGIPEDEYFRRLNTPSSAGDQLPTSNLTAAITTSGHPSSTALRSPGFPPEHEDDADVGTSPAAAAAHEGHVVSHAGAGRQPVVVHRDTRHKSSEGVLNSYLLSAVPQVDAPADDADKTPEAEYPTPAETPTEERSDEDLATPVQRARSINLGKGHARNVSAGSAKLLDIPRRGSASISSTPNPPTTPQRSQFSLNREGGSSPAPAGDA